MTSSPISLKDCGAIGLGLWALRPIISASGSIPGLSAAGMTSGLAAIGAGSLMNGLVITSAIPIAFFYMSRATARKVTLPNYSDKT